MKTCALFQFTGDNCNWYAEGDNCEIYGSADVNFGKTANEACCVCSGGSMLQPVDSSDDLLPLPPSGCYDYPIDWNDATGGKILSKGAMAELEG